MRSSSSCDRPIATERWPSFFFSWLTSPEVGAYLELSRKVRQSVLNRMHEDPHLLASVSLLAVAVRCKPDDLFGGAEPVLALSGKLFTCPVQTTRRRCNLLHNPHPSAPRCARHSTPLVSQSRRPIRGFLPSSVYKFTVGTRPIVPYFLAYLYASSSLALARVNMDSVKVCSARSCHNTQPVDLFLLPIRDPKKCITWT